jgi:hypothetical protein
MTSAPPISAEKLDTIANYLPTTGELAEVNQAFHKVYEQLVPEVQSHLGHDRPVIIAIDENLKLFADGTERSEKYIPDDYHRLKAVCHHAFGVQLMMTSNGEGQLKDLTAQRSEHVRTLIDAALAHLQEQQLPQETLESSRAILQLSRDLITESLQSATVRSAAFEKFARQVGPHLANNIAIATQRDLDHIHEIVSAWRQALGEAKWARTYVVLCEGHQMRAGQATKQYFQRLLHDKDATGAAMEDRVVYAEGCKDITAAFDLLTRHLIDQRSSRIFFGDQHRLQVDILADAAREYLSKLLPED